MTLLSEKTHFPSGVRPSALRLMNFNDAPGLAFADLWRELGIDFWPVDLPDRAYWQNAEDCVVIACRFEKISMPVSYLVSVDRVLRQLHMDEFQVSVVGKFIVFRLWWD